MYDLCVLEGVSGREWKKRYLAKGRMRKKSENVSCVTCSDCCCFSCLSVCLFCFKQELYRLILLLLAAFVSVLCCIRESAVKKHISQM